MDGFYLWILFVINSLFLFGIGVFYGLKETQIFEEVKNKENMRKEHLYLASLGTIGLTLLFIGAIVVV